ncbi:LytR C-terminal domain-containing protein [Protaetiibacter sp. SSC-01]|uniref:LytR C-terminal domain-containing protein n=1 Tax=Protaetiibacter sp. SSC-01 TaxID=2759943 RepID=UPI001656E107|nr:LytR C-terminal domain-containing protein [Protaetiibacter sp. SSC-01]QNO37967.1 LytR C-terminal domain-containing protein [Protaetiibacter sp. SSC-01]
MASFPRDRFDDIPGGVDRVGAHRAPGRRGRGWIGFGWAVLATAVLTVAGLFLLSTFDPTFKLPFAQETPTPTPTPTVVETAEPITDPLAVDPEYLGQLTLAVLNGTPTQGLSNTAGDQIAAAGWPNPSRASASNTEEPTTIVYFSNPDDEGIARGIAQLVGASDVQLSDAFPIAAITVVLGEDYVPPAPAG